MVSRALDWLRQALKDLEHAKKSIDLGDYEWACFAAQQAAEKAVKALYQKLGIEVWGRSISRMLEHLLGEYKPPRELVDEAKELDRHYIPTRHPQLSSGGSTSSTIDPEIILDDTLKKTRSYLYQGSINMFQNT